MLARQRSVMLRMGVRFQSGRLSATGRLLPLREIGVIGPLAAKADIG